MAKVEAIKIRAITDDDLYSLEDSLVPYGPGAEQLRPSLPVRHCSIPKGWRIAGVFQDQDTQHGLCYNPHIKTWFHLWWDLKGKCLTGNCQDGLWDLTWTWRPAATSLSRT